jgi:hypothetical protein
VLLARTASVGVILRRGPSHWVQLIHWDTKQDVFTPGQWFHGRIYELRCDLSLNGKLFVYAAYKPGNARKHPDYGDRWTAISKPPYFTALALWRCDFYGGGYFQKNNRMLLNHLDENREPHPQHQPKIEIIQADEYSIMHNSIFWNRLGRDGWVAGLPGQKTEVEVLEKHPGRDHETILFHTFAMIRYSKSHKRLTLFIRAIGKKNMAWDGVYNQWLYRRYAEYEYGLLDTQTSQTVTLDGATWADFDQQKRMVFARAGKLFSAELVNDEFHFSELADFNSNQPCLGEEVVEE